MKNILLFGYLGYGNLGDEVNLGQLIRLLREADAGIDITVISGDPEGTAKTYQVAAVGKFNLWGIIRALLEADLLIGNSGNLFQDLTSKRSLCYYAILVLLAKLFKTKVLLYGQGIGPLRSGFGKVLAGKVLSLADLITVRDRLSIVTLAELNVRRPEIHFTAEPLLALNEVGAPVVTSYWKEQRKDKRLKLGLIIQEYRFIKKSFWEQLLDCLSWEAKIETFLIPVQMGKDRAFLQEFAATFGLTVLEYKHDWEHLQQVVGGLDLLVSTRLHGLVAGVLQRIPCYGLAADPKVEGFCLQLGIPCSILTSETEWMAICNQITINLTRPSKECLAYPSKLPFWKARALENQAILKQYLSEHD